MRTTDRARTRTGAKPAGAPVPGLLGRAFGEQARLAKPATERGAPRAGFSFGGIAVQAKLTVGQPGDALEQEADRAAEQVARSSDPGAAGGTIQRMCPPDEYVKVQRKCAQCEDEEAKVQRRVSDAGEKGISEEDEATVAVEGVIRSGGVPLPAATRAAMESAFGHHFGQIRVHTDARAADSASALSAHAYTVGRDVVFAAGRFDPGTAAGRYLVAHELAHTIQQGAALPISRPDGVAPPAAAGGVMVQRQVAPSPAPATWPQSCVTGNTPAIPCASEPPHNNDLADLDPGFAANLRAMLADLAAQGNPFRVVEGFRNVDRQKWLYQKGRCCPGGQVTWKDGVTQTSNHQGSGTPGTGRGADCYPRHNPTAQDWTDLQNAAQQHSLNTGRAYGDEDHVSPTGH